MFLCYLDMSGHISYIRADIYFLSQSARQTRARYASGGALALSGALSEYILYLVVVASPRANISDLRLSSSLIALHDRSGR